MTLGEERDLFADALVADEWVWSAPSLAMEAALDEADARGESLAMKAALDEADARGESLDVYGAHPLPSTRPDGDRAPCFG